jgi:DNA-binding transcriptional ArsR family regulator
MRRRSVSEHLKVLKDAGLVIERRHGRMRLYELRGEPLREVAEWLTPLTGRARALCLWTM